MTATANASLNSTAISRRPWLPFSPFLPPVSVAAITGIAAYRYGIHPSVSATPDAIAMGSGIASVGGTMLGFMLAALAVLASVSHTHLIKMMRQSGHYDDLLATLFAGGLMFLCCVLLGFTLLFGALADPILMSAIVAVHLGALVSVVDVARKFWLVLSNLSPST
jgi:hypothetical protein